MARTFIGQCENGQNLGGPDLHNPVEPCWTDLWLWPELNPRRSAHSRASMGYWGFAHSIKCRARLPFARSGGTCHRRVFRREKSILSKTSQKSGPEDLGTGK